MATRWGIASAGRICHDFTNALATLSSNEHKVVANAATNLQRAQEFGKLHKIQKSYGSYEELAKDPDVEIVYVGMLNPQHLEVSKLMLSNGKHVLVEKPLTMNLKETRELVGFAKEKGLFLMEALWSRCFPIYEAVKNEIKSGAIGDIVQIIVSLGFQLTHVPRLNIKAQGGGTILDLGVYPIQFVEFIYEASKPSSIKTDGYVNKEGVDVSMTAILKYENNRSATILTSSLANYPNEAIVIGTKGIIKIPNFWCPTTAEMPSGNIDFPLPNTAPLEFFHFNSAGLRYEAMEARACIKSGLEESSKVTHKDSLLIAEIEDELRRQIGVVYPQDN